MKEPLNVLPVTRFLLRWGIRLNILGIAFLGFLAVSSAIHSDELARFVLENPQQKVSGVFVEVSPLQAMATASIVLAASLVTLVLLLILFRTLVKIVDSVCAGDPFVPENGPRLRRIAWLLVYMQLTSVGTGLSLSMMFGVFQFRVTVNNLFGPVLGGALIALLAFILARVFEAGSAMRSEIRETV